MRRYAPIALAASVTAVTIGGEEANKKNVDVDDDILPQGRGMDHTLWSWPGVLKQQRKEVTDAGKEVKDTHGGVTDATKALNKAKNLAPTKRVIAEEKCEKKRNEEVNLFYQCTQDAINNYSLDHFGGEVRSYPRWLTEFKVCMKRMSDNSHCKEGGNPKQPDNAATVNGYKKNWGPQKLIYRQTRPYYMASKAWLKDFGNDKDANMSRLGSAKAECTKNGAWTFTFVWPGIGYNRWQQTNDPFTVTKTGPVTGYKALDVNFRSAGWGGLEYSRNQGLSLADGSTGATKGTSSAWWWYSVGTNKDYRSG